ncbi:MAG: DUF4382 domain-containing protein [Bacteroidetes bacterium]|nr:DUF4382 domain-containing protein [Bacteroidota bacterium]MCW5895700.1 DUF4382 domain-containing protein [Bacteroidota bacterium]
MTRVLYSFLVVLPLFLLSSCLKDHDPTGPDPEGETGTLIIRMTDSPITFDSVLIRIDSVRIHASNSDTLSSGWHTINRTRAVYNLLSLTNGVDTVIGRAPLPPGTYSQLRLHIGTGSRVVVGGVSHPLTIPSGSQSGLKLNIHATIEPNTTYTLLLDFDAARSILRTGNGSFMLRPVLRVITTAQTGTISGHVVPASTRPIVTAYNAMDTISTMADASGAYTLAYLPPSSYFVHFAPTDTTYRDFTVAGVIVWPGVTTPLGTITLQPR